MEINQFLEEFYSKDLKLSYSALKLMLYSPKMYASKYIYKDLPDWETPATRNGKLVHCVLLEIKNFSEKYIIGPDKLPAENILGIIKRCFAKRVDQTTLKDFKDSILEELKYMNLHQLLKTDAQRLDKVCTENANKYFEFLLEAEGKSVISQAEFDSAEQNANVVKNNARAREILGINVTEFDNIDVYTELALECPFATFDFEVILKGILDNITINHDQAIIYVNDFKNITSKDLKDFKNSVDEFKYNLQMKIYDILVQHNFRDLISKGYKILHHFVVLDKNSNCYCFPVSADTMEVWSRQLVQALDQFGWHYRNKSYNLPYEFEQNLVIL